MELQAKLPGFDVLQVHPSVNHLAALQAEQVDLDGSNEMVGGEVVEVEYENAQYCLVILFVDPKTERLHSECIIQHLTLTDRAQH